MVNANMLAKVFGEGGIIEWWQLLLIGLLIAIIVFYVMYRRKQM